ncbi:MAG: MoxR family ATPase [Spirochaetes bacterium]|nr:MoxR family ATPase [Spirochaetota bacterium]
MNEQIKATQAAADSISANIEKVIVGKHDRIKLLLTAFLCRGHVLINDVPGLGKTMLARAFATSIGGQFKRIQCTPDLLPSDIMGVSIYNPETKKFNFHKGSIFSQIVLVDEINRATPRTQSGFLEAMGENQVSIEGQTFDIPDPFIILATQNPIEFEGTFPLPEAQMDRFFFSFDMGYPTLQDEMDIIEGQRIRHPIEDLKSVIKMDDISGYRDHVSSIYIEDDLKNYIISIVEKTRDDSRLALGVSPRGSIALFKASQALAILNGRDYVIPDDIKFLTPYTLSHRVIVKASSRIKGYTGKTIISEILQAEKVPLEEPGEA